MGQDLNVQMLKLCAQVTKYIFYGFSDSKRSIRCLTFFQPVFFAGAVGDKCIASAEKCAEMADNARRRNLIKAHRQRRSDDIRSLLAWKNRDASVDGLLASDDELDARERAFGK
ncbi:Uncharacterised protein [Klebsiella pneumoniae]|uniref:Uncharacterized protein n=4 Tax=Klebsiella pneumoniae TaxID=573 RepID=A0A377YU33_KLEPO|nr:hypothetical protein [Klebsiella pneumoniae]STU54311.1 Uncharacterised protein [Klebsiella pneumoniae subsp. ozaenae]VFS17935.1 Uncharacterised protein [Serratia liquefaciens]KHF62092.1 hypothetical protein LV59_05261 [Klebsiella pneumoniae]MDP8008769.1 hypothetical protein [Klebsiella pneumoniae subsp. pneumoniae]MDP8022624.1 hypothetical protein [Klebsiella pneumoniae subsp. pneumoniae]